MQKIQNREGEKVAGKERFLHNLIATHYHHSHTTEKHTNTKENSSKYSKKYSEIQIKVEIRCPHEKSYDPGLIHNLHHSQYDAHLFNRNC